MDSYFSRNYDDLSRVMMPGRVLVIYGPRRVGKTTLVEHYLSGLGGGQKILRASGDNLSDSNVLGSRESSLLLEWVSGYDVVFIDEAQRIPQVGLGLKILIDARPDLCVISTGSSGFDLSGKLGEPLTGRQVPLRLYPLSVKEMAFSMNDYELKANLEDFLIYGMYPEVRTAVSGERKQFILNELSNAYLLKDILELEHLKKPKLLLDLLTLIASQIGKEVSLNELSNSLKVDIKTVARYLDLLEKCFVLYNLRGFSRNLRSEVTRTSRYYFYDNGVRNALIRNFNPLKLRNDQGELWENFVVMERLKYRSYAPLFANDYFWRTWEQQEIDLIEEYDGLLHAYEFKWSTGAGKSTGVKMPKTFAAAYPGSSFTVITPENFLDFLRHERDYSRRVPASRP
jgi:predicted AAA+ superfamily ATPase